MERVPGAPVIPTELRQYNAWLEDPKWQRNFSIIWLSLSGIVILASAPHLHAFIKKGRAFKGFFGISNHLGEGDYSPMKSEERKPIRRMGRAAALLQLINSLRLWTLPKLNVNTGQMFSILAYFMIVLLCSTLSVPLIENPNRAGFIALAQLPVVFIFATKNSLVSILLGPGNGYESLNYIHRWTSRTLFLGVLAHTLLWMRNHIQYDQPISGRKGPAGFGAFGLLCGIVIFSLKPFRRRFYQAFFIIHIVCIVSFLFAVCYHTGHAKPWVFLSLIIYGADVIWRLFRFRTKNATLIAIDNQMTIIRVADCNDGWVAGQHIRLRVFFSRHVFESHPLTILSAPPSISCLSTSNLKLAARVTGRWSRDLNNHAFKIEEPVDDSSLGLQEHETPVRVMIDGPYGGCSIDLGDYENVLLIAGGSGVTFTLGLLDDIVGRCIKLGRRGEEQTRRIEFVWCVRSSVSIEWFAPMLMEIATMAAGTSLDLHISIYITRGYNIRPRNLIPNSDTFVDRPSIQDLLVDLVTHPGPENSNAVDVEATAGNKFLEGEGLNQMTLGGVAVCASGPEILTRDASNAVARVALSRGMQLGGIALHTESFTL